MRSRLYRRPKLNTRKIYEKLVKNYVKYWRHALKLDNWTITSEVVDEYDSYASMHTSPTSSTCELKILNPDNVPKEWKGVRDLEVTVVHELLHTRWHYAVRSAKRDDHLEQAIEATAISMVAAKRNVKIEEIK